MVVCSWSMFTSHLAYRCCCSQYPWIDALGKASTQSPQGRQNDLTWWLHCIDSVWLGYLSIPLSLRMMDLRHLAGLNAEFSPRTALCSVWILSHIPNPGLGKRSQSSFDFLANDFSAAYSQYISTMMIFLSLDFLFWNGLLFSNHQNFAWSNRIMILVPFSQPFLP